MTWRREISTQVAIAVMKMAKEEGLLKNPKAINAMKLGGGCLHSWVVCQMYKPKYTSLIHLPTGVGE